MCVSNNNNSLREDEQQWQGREIGEHGCLAQAWGEECVFLFHSEFNYGWSVHGGMD